MHINTPESELPKLEPESFEFTESLGAGVDVGLFSETIVSALGVKFHGDPVVSCVMRWLFKASAIYIFRIVFLLLSHYLLGRLDSLPRATKGESFIC